ncbi:unnamed protein product [Candida verbasci]|uniref:Raptor N-terminal CASPase-like domain-containing protein n=1 Tax=Candida verbasci TaxID=1227364 RepID=A0A9W4TUF6_9ASCO|nr:unnamed protein product [Candida verbasci]
MKERQKTISAVLVLCLNLGIPPPDVIKTSPCAKYEACIDPTTYNDTKKALENIGKNLQAQYETLSIRTRYKQSLDPCVEDVKRFCNTLRRNAKEERILFHYNGHGVPQPTSSGELWVFNRGYTQYIPISLYDLQTWLGAPVIFVYDCSSAGNILHNFKKFVQKRIDDDNDGNHDQSAPSLTSAYLDCIQLAACRSNELLPMSPDVPADLFTCCLTCPINISIKWFIMQSSLKIYDSLPKNSIGNIQIPGKLTDRRTPLGELNWIFTAITDTIAWTSLSRPIFKRLFRQDLMVAALFRNFLLAKRIIPHLNCNPISDPPLPDSVRFHPMWDSWDLAIDQILSQLLKNEIGTLSNNYQHSTFFEQQLTAFEIWLKYNGPFTKEPPEQLPIVLQVLLSQVHRLRALILLSKFLDLGPWAVYLSLSIGIFPYVLKLLQSPAQELKPVLIFIWARIMAIDYKGTQQELCKEKGYNYFYLILNSNQPVNNLINDDHKAMSAFIITLCIKDFKNGQRLCFSTEIISNCLRFIQTSENPLLRQWCALLLSQLWNKYPDGKWIVLKDRYINHLLTLINDPIPEVRTSIVVALTNYLSDLDQPDIRKDEIRQQDLNIANAVLGLLGDGSSMVRKELIYFMNKFVQTYSKFFLVVAFNQLEEEIVLIDNANYLNEFRKRSPAYSSIFSSVWKALLILSEDPHCEVQQLAETLIDYIMIKLNQSELSSLVKEMQNNLLSKSTKNISESFTINRPIRVQSGQVKKNDYKIDGSVLITRSVSANHTDDVSDSESITSKIKNLSMSKLFKSFHINDDNELKNLTRFLNSAPVNSTYGSEYRPKSAYYKIRDLNKFPELSNESGFFEYSCEYFQEPQMSKNEADEPGSKDFVQSLWRRNRNESIINETQPQKIVALRGDWTKDVRILDNKTQPKCIKFTQFEKILAVSDEKDNVTIWDWESNQIIKKFSNGNPFGTKITDIKYLNEDDLPLLLTGSSDGVIKIYTNFHNYEYGDDKIELVTGWRALTDLLLTSKSSGLISEWQQSRGSLVVSGDVKIIRIWDAPTELCISDIPARSSSSITSLTSDQVAGNVFIAGFDDGSIRVYDRRLDSRESMVKTWRTTKYPNGKIEKDFGFGSIRNVHMQRGGFRELISGSSDGYVNIWDIRLDDPVLSYKNFEKSMRTMDVHEHAPILATGLKTTDIWSTSGDLLTNLKSQQNDKYLSTRVTANYLSTSVFHPHRMMLATNYNQDSHINIYTCTDTLVEY